MNSHEPCIIQSGFINNLGAFFNDELLLKNDSNDFETFTNNLYKQLDIKYPKFYKMDNLCKIGFLASEIALKNIDLHQKYSADKIGIHIINTNSSIDTDIKYQKLINQGTASPAVFVYTLPNIVIGEISIKNNFKGENLLMVSENYDIELQYNYINSLFISNSIDACICGFVDYTETAYEAFFIHCREKQYRILLLYTPTH
ncbi:MAG: 3-oxoacyl-ACP synthase [Saprospirales bacterium]|nr:3-oxoacyl-ACP synthase [Saprospirales bacterium]